MPMSSCCCSVVFACISRASCPPSRRVPVKASRILSQSRFCSCANMVEYGAFRHILGLPQYSMPRVCTTRWRSRRPRGSRRWRTPFRSARCVPDLAPGGSRLGAAFDCAPARGRGPDICRHGLGDLASHPLQVVVVLRPALHDVAVAQRAIRRMDVVGDRSRLASQPLVRLPLDALARVLASPSSKNDVLRKPPFLLDGVRLRPVVEVLLMASG